MPTALLYRFILLPEIYMKANSVFRLQLPAFLLLIFFSSCKEQKLFIQVNPDHTGIHFQNRIMSSDSLNILHYLYYYNGGGVAVGDINNDGLEDIYFTSNQQSNKLYLNKGNFRFQDITDQAHVQGGGNWKTGVTMADVNADGLPDIYVCEVGRYKTLKGRNELFINNGDLTFTERGKEYGLNIEGFNTQATFFDYDKDGDLDMFLVNHSVHSTETFADASVREKAADVSGDKLFRNDKDGKKRLFTEVTKEAGIYNSAIGYGLNVITADFNNDHWDDIYVSNDFHENDYYYINLKDGSFREINKEAFGHQSRFSMGSDAGDINNDGWLDLITLDMLPEDEKILKSSVSDDAPDIYQWKVNHGYHHQLARNCLQLNVDGGRRFSDIALYAGVAATDWSWSPLLADFDNDGIKDLFITNGITKRPNDLDYLKFISSPAISAALNRGQSADSITINKMPPGEARNYMYKGTPGLNFLDMTAAWAPGAPTLSNGAAYGDLDNDGDLDLVTNNINEPARIYRNDNNKLSTNHFLDIRLEGTGENVFAYGAKVLVKHKSQMQINYVTASRGFQSSSTRIMHFGLGADRYADTVQIIWPDQRLQTFINVAADQRLSVSQTDAIVAVSSLLPVVANVNNPFIFRDITKSINLTYSHKENNFIDFNSQGLIPHEVSSRGPKIAVADINNDGLDDFFICGAKDQPGNLFYQTGTGGFSRTNESLFNNDAFAEDVNAVFFDADNDGDSDLYVVSGGNEITGPDPALPDRMYLNDGKGNFSKAPVPAIFENKAVAAPADFDHDGDIDLFIGGAVVAGSYGTIPGSYLLINNGKGNFIVGARSLAPGLHAVGMVTDAVWSDIDKDGWTDLIIVGEWMPVTVFRNEKGVLVNITGKLKLQATTGLWTTIHATDIDHNGYPDLLVGNRGENSKLQATEKYPLKLFVADVDHNGQSDQILSIEKEKKYYPFVSKEVLERQLPLIRKKYTGYSEMAGRTTEEIFDDLTGYRMLSVNTLSSMLLKNDRGRFSISRLPAEVQWSPVFAFLAGDFNGDKKTDFLSAGNFFGVTPHEGRYDAGYGNVVLRDDTAFNVLFPLRSGFVPEGQVRDIKKLRTINNRSLYLVARNNDSILFYENIR